MSAPAAGPGPGAEARLVEAIAAALERGAARAEPVAVLVAVVPGEDCARAAALDADRAELPPEGLAVVLGGGRIALLLPGVGGESARARAATFVARWPGVRAGAAASEASSGPIGPDALLAEAEAEALRGGRRRILVVEDDPDFGEILEVFLRDRGRFEVFVARTGAEAVAAARARPPDAALVDLELPDIDGAALVARLREAVPDLPAIACSGKRPEDAAGAGFTAFHRKPLDLSAVVRAVNAALRRPDPP
ncbi:MAG TPA: response regulator [Anaeromyxobacter sp.]